MKRELLERGMSGNKKYPWDSMDVGDFFEVPGYMTSDANIRMQCYFRKRDRKEQYRVNRLAGLFRVTRLK